MVSSAISIARVRDGSTGGFQTSLELYPFSRLQMLNVLTTEQDMSSLMILRPSRCTNFRSLEPLGVFLLIFSGGNYARQSFYSSNWVDYFSILHEIYFFSIPGVRSIEHLNEQWPMLSCACILRESGPAKKRPPINTVRMYSATPYRSVLAVLLTHQGFASSFLSPCSVAISPQLYLQVTGISIPYCPPWIRDLRVI